MRLPLKYNLRNLLVRRTTVAMTVSSIAFVVLVYVGVLGLARGLQATFSGFGEGTNVLVLRDGAPSEIESAFALEKRRQVEVLPEVARNAAGQPLASGQVVVLQVLTDDRGEDVNVPLRGVEPAYFALRPGVRSLEGRLFEPGRGEIVVGRDLARRSSALRPGGEVTLGLLTFRVVGTFEAPGGAFGSEIWGSAQEFAAAYRRREYSSVLVRAASPERVEGLVAQIEADQQLQLKAVPEVRYFADQARTTSLPFLVLGNALAWLMAFGACFAAANTMLGQVSARAAEIGTLRALGFGRATVFSAIVVESALLGLVAGLLGVVLSLPLNQVSAATTNMLTFGGVSFSLRTSPGILFGGLILALATALAGGVPAAWSAARRPITRLLRDR